MLVLRKIFVQWIRLHDEFFTHMDAKWVSIEDTSTASNQNMHSELTQDNLFHKSIVFVIDCKTMEQIASAVATMPGAGLSDIEVFPCQKLNVNNHGPIIPSLKLRNNV